MSIASWTFASFVAFVLAAYRLTPPPYRRLALLGASIVFYAWAFPAHAVVLALLALGTWLVGRRVVPGTAGRTRLLAWAVTALLLVLGAYKYADMAEQTAAVLLSAVGLAPLDLPRLVAPLGLSYATFMLVHYLAELYRGNATPAREFTDFALYAFFFPTAVSGPIKRYPQFVSDLEKDRRLTLEDASAGIGRIIFGLFKKVVIADLLIAWTVPLTDRPGVQDPLALLVAVYAYTFVIYFDFSGYSDMAIGVARLFGFTIIENFEHPYLRSDLSRFWRTWHISLTRFITENVYIPLGGSRRGSLRTAGNTMVAMLASGLWHGAAWHYVVWGGLHGAGLIVARAWGGVLGRVGEVWPAFARAREHRVGRATGWALGTGVTFNFVAMLWVVFLLPLSDALVVWERIARAVVRALMHAVGW